MATRKTTTKKTAVASSDPFVNQDVGATVAKMKEEILRDIANGTVPDSVKSFSELHDYVDANCYGGFCDGPTAFDGSDAHIDFVNECQDAVSDWLAAGRPSDTATASEGSEADHAVAHELACTLRWHPGMRGQGDTLANHLRKLLAKPGFDENRYAAFLAKTWVKPAALAYYGNKADADRFVNKATALEAGHIFVDSFIAGDFDEKKQQGEATAAGEGKRITTTYENWDEDALDAGDTDDRGYSDEEGALFEDEADGETAVEQAIDWLQRAGATEFSDSGFSTRGWYSTESSTDMHSGDVSIESFHLNDAWTDEEKEAIYNGVIKGILPTKAEDNDLGAIASQFSKGDTVHVDSDTEDWGRVAADGVVESVDSDGCLVYFQSLMATIFIPSEDIAKASVTEARAIASLQALASALTKEGMKHTTAFATEGEGFPHILPPSDHESEQYLDEHLIHWHSGMDAIYALASNWCTRDKHDVPREAAQDAIDLLERHKNDPRYAEDVEELSRMIECIQEAIDEADAFGRGDRDSGFYYNWYNTDGTEKGDEATASAQNLVALAQALASAGVAHEVVAYGGGNNILPKSIEKISQGIPFSERKGNVTGTPTFKGKGWAENGPASAAIDAAREAGADYWLYSYQTPIGARINGQWYEFPGKYTLTTTGHQGILGRLGAKNWSAFDTTGRKEIAPETEGRGLF